MTGPQPKPNVPLRIKRLTLRDFRAFPGPAPVHFDLDGKNLLVYGENGSGKSSIFHALTQFFSLKPTRNLRTLKNVFSGLPETDCTVTVDFNDGAPGASWRLQAATSGILAGRIREHHPAAISGGNDARVIQTALRRACLDYRALFDTNYKHGDGAVNLFDIAVEKLLSDFTASVAGGIPRTIGELWRAVDQAKPVKRTAAALARVNQACTEFNSGFSQALAALHPLVGTLLGQLIGSDVTVAPFVFGGITYTDAYYKRDREIAGRRLTLDVSYRSHELKIPQQFLNEARLSALALAIYLAGRLAYTPTATPNALKLLVLDDVLIGLDHSNRLPVLDVLHQHFADWQIVLMTHDRTWFDLARDHVAQDAWVCWELYEGDAAATAPMPIARKTENRPAKALLAKARALVLQGYIEAAANYTRQAFEHGLRGGCAFRKVPMRYLVDSKGHKAQDLLDALRIAPKPGSVPQPDWTACLQRITMFKNVVMNPYSHPSAPNIPRQEVVDAANAVEKFLELVGKK